MRAWAFYVIQGFRAEFSCPGLTLMEGSASGLGLLDLIIGHDKELVSS